MNENENLVVEQITENVEQTTEETPAKVFTQEELNAAVGKAKARERAKLERQYQKKYGDIEDVLKAGMEVSSIEEAREGLRTFYAQKGKPVPQKPSEMSMKDIETLAKAEANEAIGYGYDYVVEEVDRLTEVGAENMTPRDKAYFKVLAEHRQNTERQNELAKIGVTEEVFNSKEFQDFAADYKPNTPIEKIWNNFQKTQPKKDIKPMGSMKNSTSEDGTVKDFYTRDEALQFTKKDLDKNPALYKAIQESMLKW